MSGTRPAPARGAPGRATVSQTSARRFARRQWRRRLRRARPALVVGVLLVVGGFVVWAVWFSSLLDVRTVTVTGLPKGTPLAAADVRAAAKVPLGEPLSRVDLDAARAGVLELPALKTATVSRAWPHDVLVEVTERTAVAAWRDGSAIKLVDADSVVFRTVTQPPAGLIPVTVQLKSGQRTVPTLRSVVGVLTGLPRDLRAQVTAVSAQSPDTVQLSLRSGAVAMWGSAEQSGQKAKVLGALLKHRTEDKVKVYDVSVPAYPTTRS